MSVRDTATQTEYGSFTTEFSRIDNLISNLTRIETLLNRTTGKYTEVETIDLFVNDETFTEEARLIAVEAVNGAYSGSWKGPYEFTHGTCGYLRVEVARLRKQLRNAA